jgi:hypothetical protein
LLILIQEMDAVVNRRGWLVVFLISILIGVLFFIPRPQALAQVDHWQDTLAQHFDIVETFDQLQDWRGQSGGHPIGDVSNPGDMPLKTDGSESIWEYYSYWGTVPAADRPSWISSRSPENLWRGQGKSLAIDYGGVWGPSRLAFSIGYAPSDGYEEVYIFFMSQYKPEFFPKHEDSFDWFGFLKTFQISSGFRDILDWGTVQEQQIADDTPQDRNIYGLNAAIINFKPFSGSLKVAHNIYTSTPSGTSSQSESDVQTNHMIQADLSDAILAGEWFGLEYRFLLSSPHGEAGAFEAWVYDSSGNVVGHEAVNLPTLRDATNWGGGNPGGFHAFDHHYNKFVWGGNRDDYIQKGFLKCHPFTSDPESDEIYVSSHAKRTGDMVAFYTEGSLPQPIEDSQDYFVIKVDENTFRLADSFSGAIQGQAINLTSSGSGTGYVSCSSYLYIDDIVVNDGRIGPTYFTLLGEVQTLEGDLNLDGVVDPADLQLCLDIILGWNPDPVIFQRADLNLDSQVDALDLQRLILIIPAP